MKSKTIAFRNQKHVLAILFLLCINLFASGQTKETEMTKVLTNALQETPIPGMVVSMISKDSILYQNGFGYANIESKVKYTPKHIQNIGSVSKTVIGISLMKLVERKLINLDDPVNQYLPFQVTNPYHPTVPITIRHLATHTSSIKDRLPTYLLKAYFLKSAYSSTKGLSLTNKLFLKKIAKNKRVPLNIYLPNVLDKKGNWYKRKNFTKKAPGKQYEYSNIGATLAAYIVEIVAGMPYSEFTQKEIFEPLNMGTTSWFYKDMDEDRFVKRYIGKKRSRIPDYDISTYPDGALKTTMLDLNRFFQEMMKGYVGEGHLLSTESYQALFKNHLNDTHEKRSGLFWELYGKGTISAIGHSGSDPGILTFMYFKPTTQIGKIMFFNSSGLEKQAIPIWQKFVQMEKLFLE